MDYNNHNHSSLLVGISPFKKIKPKKKKPMKVVYISNPMKFKTSASEFRALVQELTGQDSELPPPHPNNLSYALEDNSDNDPMVLNEDESLKEDQADDDDSDNNNDRALDLPAVDPFQDRFEREPSGGDNNEVSATYESFEDVFVPQMFENLSGLIPSSTLCYESAHLDVLRSLDAM